MKHLTGITILDIIIAIPLVLCMLLLPDLFDKLFPNNKSPNRIEGDFETWLKENNNELCYVVKKVKNKKVSLTQYVEFYMYVKKGNNVVFENITDYLPTSFTNILSSGQFYSKKSKLNGTWEFTDFDIVEFTNELQKKYPNVTLKLVDEDVVNC